ncbi:MAG: HPr family phosphocarrier protein [Eubacterium sp.]|jgi:phosphotransferase system HPr-like phosphotransfer protein|nr:HPr family phosphocarrier protein [Eubacterium sp.]
MTNSKIILSSIDDVKEFVSIILKADFSADLSSGKYVVDAKSIMGIFSLDLSKPLDLKIHSENGAEFLDKIKKFIVK